MRAPGDFSSIFFFYLFFVIKYLGQRTATLGNRVLVGMGEILRVLYLGITDHTGHYKIVSFSTDYSARILLRHCFSAPFPIVVAARTRLKTVQ